MVNYLNTEIKISEDQTKRAGEAFRFKAGEVGGAMIKNIYDLAGNTREWTMETRGLEMRAIRGGDCYVYGRAFSVSNREEDYRPTVSGAGCHAMLYIK